MRIGIDIGIERIYNKAFEEKGLKEVVKWDVQKIRDGQFIKINFISKKSESRQGIWIATDKGLEVNGTTYPQIDLWQDTAPPEIKIRCFTEVGLFSIYNIWDDGDGRESQAYSSGMLVQEKDNIITYKCNDYGFDTDFNKLIFTVEKI